ncbi:Ig-like domain-containing protein [Herbaspirillum seropedicae]|uniref:Ig-like domain-containing protein n=1 Tax=Herbaspirillum seropedicae TaxID=964 RepID=UPI003D9678A9
MSETERSHLKKLEKVTLEDTGFSDVRWGSFSITHEDVAGNVNSNGSGYHSVETTVPIQVDMNGNESGVSRTTKITPTMLRNGVAFAPDVSLTSNVDGHAIDEIRVYFSGRYKDFSDDKIILDAEFSRSQNIAATSGKTIGSVSEVTYSYRGGDYSELLFTRNDPVTGSKHFSKAEAEEIIENIKLKSPSGKAGDISMYVSVRGNFVSSESSVRLEFDKKYFTDTTSPDSKEEPPQPDVRPAGSPRLELEEDSGIKRSDKITNNGKVKISDIPAEASWQWSSDQGKTWSTQSTESESHVILTGDGEKTLMVKVTDKSGKESTSTLAFTLDTVAERPSVQTEGYYTPTPLLKGTAEKGARIVFSDYYGKTLSSTDASSKDGSWSMRFLAGGKMSGLKKADGSDSSANGTYTLLTLSESQAIQHSFSNDFSFTGKPVLDTSRPTYSMKTPSETWYVWAPQGGDYLISRMQGSDEWYLRDGASDGKSTPHWGSWYSSNLTAPQLLAEPVLEDGTRSHQKKQTYEYGGGFKTANEFPYAQGDVRVQQIDIAGNVSDLNRDSYFSPTTTSPSRFDIDPGTPGTQSTVAHYATASDLIPGTAFVPDADKLFSKVYYPTPLRIQFSGAGLDLAKDRLLLDEEISLNKNVATRTGRTIGDVAGIEYSFDASNKTLSINQDSKRARSLERWEVGAIIKAIKLQNPESQTGERIMTVKPAWYEEQAWSWTASLTVGSDSLALKADPYSSSAVDHRVQMLTKTGLLETGVSLHQEVLAPVSNQIRALQVKLSGAGLSAEDKLRLDLGIRSPSKLSALQNDADLGNLRYAYDAKEQTLTIDSASGQALTGAQVQALVKLVKLVNPLGLDGERQAQFRLIGMDGEMGTPSTTRLLVDTQAPVLDLDFFTPGTQSLSEKTINLARANPDWYTPEGLFVHRITAPAANDVARIKLQFSGKDPSLSFGEDAIVPKQRSYWDRSEKIDLSKTNSAHGQRIGELTDISYTYDAATKELVFQKRFGESFLGTEVKMLLETLQYKIGSKEPGTRSIDITLTDQAGNSSSATTRIKLDTTPAPVVKAELVAQNQMSYQVLNLGDILGQAHPHNLSKGESVNLPLPVGMDAQTFLAAIKGISAEWGGRGITGSPNTTSAEYKSYLAFDRPLTSGQSFGMAHQGGAYVKGNVFSFTATADGKGLVLANKGGSYASNLDMYQFSGSEQSSNGNYDIGNIRILYQVDTGMSNLNPTVKVKFNASEASVGDVVSVKTDYYGTPVVSKTLTADDLASPEASVSLTLAKSLLGSYNYLYTEYKEASGNIASANGISVYSYRPQSVDAPVLSDLKVASPNKGSAQALNDSTTQYASISDAGTPWAPGNYDRGLQFGGKVGTEGSSDKYLITVKLGGKVLAFDTVNAGDFTLSSAANLIAPGLHEDLSFTATNITAGNNNGTSSTVTGLKLGHYWAAQSLGDTRGGHGNDNFLLGATKNGLNTLIQTNGGDDTLTLGAFGKKGNFAATVTDFTAGADKIAVFGKSIDLGNLQQFVKEVAPIQGGNGTKVVVDLDGAAAGNQTYTLHLQNVAYQPANTHTLFGV